MTPFELHPDFYNRPIRLTEDEQAEPVEVLRSFFLEQPMSQVRQQLWKMMEACLGTPDEMAFETPEQRENLLLFCHELEQALEAALLLSEKLPRLAKPTGHLVPVKK